MRNDAQMAHSDYVKVFTHDLTKTYTTASLNVNGSERERNVTSNKCNSRQMRNYAQMAYSN